MNNTDGCHKESEMIKALARVHDELDYLKDDIDNLMENLEPVMRKDCGVAIKAEEVKSESAYTPSTLIVSLERIFTKVSDDRSKIKEILNRIEC